MPFRHDSTDYAFLETFVEQHITDFSKFAFYVVHDYDCAQDGIQNALEANVIQNLILTSLKAIETGNSDVKGHIQAIL